MLAGSLSAATLASLSAATFGPQAPLPSPPAVTMAQRIKPLPESEGRDRAVVTGAVTGAVSGPKWQLQSDLATFTHSTRPPSDSTRPPAPLRPPYDSMRPPSDSRRPPAALPAVLSPLEGKADAVDTGSGEGAQRFESQDQDHSRDSDDAERMRTARGSAQGGDSEEEREGAERAASSGQTQQQRDRMIAHC